MSPTIDKNPRELTVRDSRAIRFAIGRVLRASMQLDPFPPEPLGDLIGRLDEGEQRTRSAA